MFMLKGYAKKQVKVLNEAYKNKKLIFYTYIYDALFYFLLIMGFLVFGIILVSKGNNLAGVDYAGITSGDLIKMNHSYNLLVGFFITMVSAIVVYLVYVTLIFSFFKGKIWLDLFGKKGNWKHYLKFFIFNLIFLGIFFSIFVYFVLEKKIFAAYSFVVVGIHFIYIFSYFFTKLEKTGKAIGKTFFYCWRIDKVILPYLVIGICFYLVYNGLFFISSYMTKSWYLLISMIILLFVATLSKIYLKNLFDHEYNK
jgi:hypothetical protein